jgi:uncharacterized protein YkwD
MQRFRRRTAARPIPVLVAVALLACTVGGLIRPAPAVAGTAETMESSVITWINRDRSDRGLRPLRYDRNLASVAGIRAAAMASKNTLTHSAGGDLAKQLASYGVTCYAFGEAIGSSTAEWGLTAATRLYAAWKGSSQHWAMFMSSRYNYVGVGFAYRSSGATTYGSVVLTESPDHTPPTARMTDVSRVSTTVTWHWTGAEVALQTHTSGLRDFEIQYRYDGSDWHTITHTTWTSWQLANRAHARYHYLRVRARDWAGNLSAWTPYLRIWVP